MHPRAINLRVMPVEPGGVVNAGDAGGASSAPNDARP